MLEILINVATGHLTDENGVFARARRHFQQARIEAARIVHDAMTSGAMPSECQPTWRYRYGASVWPSL